MKGLAIIGSIVSSLLILATLGCALGGIWTDKGGRVDDISIHLWGTVFILIIPAAFSTLLTCFAWGAVETKP